MPNDANSFYTPQGMQTNVQTPGIGLQGAAGSGQDQLLALLGPAIAAKRQQALLQQQLALRASQREDQQLQAQLQSSANQQAFQREQYMDQQEANNPLSGRNQKLKMEKSLQNRLQQAAQGRQRQLADLDSYEDVFVSNMSGPNMVSGNIRTFAGDPRGVYAGQVKKGSTQPGGVNLQGSGSGSGTPQGGMVRNSLADEALRQRMQGQVEDDGSRASSIPGGPVGYSADFTAPKRR